MVALTELWWQNCLWLWTRSCSAKCLSICRIANIHVFSRKTSTGAPEPVGVSHRVILKKKKKKKSISRLYLYHSACVSHRWELGLLLLPLTHSESTSVQHFIIFFSPPQLKMFLLWEFDKYQQLRMKWAGSIQLMYSARWAGGVSMTTNTS